MEKWNLYDENRQLTDKIINRGEKIPHDLYRLVVHACIFNKKGQMLIQKRSGTKKSNPHIWDITLGGCAQMGETSKMAIKRELNEELGLDYNFSNERPFLTINFDSGFDDFYLIKTSIALNDIKFKDNEVEKVKWASKKEILKMIKEKTFIQYHTSLIALLFDMRKTRGVHSKKQ